MGGNRKPDRKDRRSERRLERMKAAEQRTMAVLLLALRRLGGSFTFTDEERKALPAGIGIEIEQVPGGGVARISGEAPPADTAPRPENMQPRAGAGASACACACGSPLPVRSDGREAMSCWACFHAARAPYGLACEDACCPDHGEATPAAAEPAGSAS